MEPSRTAVEVEADFDAMRAQWQDLANADDPVGVAAFYAEDAVFSDVYGNVYNGREAIQWYLEGSFATGADLVVETTDVVFHGDMVAGYGTFAQTVTGPEGDMPMQGMWQTVSMYQPDGTILIHVWSTFHTPDTYAGLSPSSYRSDVLEHWSSHAAALDDIHGVPFPPLMEKIIAFRYLAGR